MLSLCKTKIKAKEKYLRSKNIKMENNEFKKALIKNSTCYFLYDIIEFEDCYFHNILIDEKSYKNILIYDILYKTLIVAKQLPIRFDKIDIFIRIDDRNRYLV